MDSPLAAFIEPEESGNIITMETTSRETEPMLEGATHHTMMVDSTVVNHSAVSSSDAHYSKTIPYPQNITALDITNSQKTVDHDSYVSSQLPLDKKSTHEIMTLVSNHLVMTPDSTPKHHVMAKSVIMNTLTADNEDFNSDSIESEYSDAEDDLDMDTPKNMCVRRSEVNRLLLSEQGDHVSEDALHVPTVEIISIRSKCAEQAEEFVRKVWEAGWRVVHHHSLPIWLKDNDYLIRGHRPPNNSFVDCFKSIFSIHTETGNIWTHLLGMIAFIGVAAYFLTRPSLEIQWQEKAVFSAFFAGAILCMTFSWLFHTVFCHSEKVGKLFIKLDYCGIALLTMGSFVPWLYYIYYCRLIPKVFYLTLIFILGTACIIVSMWDKFAEPKFRSVRAGVFIALGLSGVIPAMHYVITDGFHHAVEDAALGWLVLMAVLYITGALIYAFRIPERLFPGKFDIWSHTIFHVFVMAAAFVHYHCISEVANYRLTFGDCIEWDLGF